jgi:hypothetical protein
MARSEDFRSYTAVYSSQEVMGDRQAHQAHGEAAGHCSHQLAHETGEDSPSSGGRPFGAVVVWYII